jgi:hypothetical protein
MRFRITKPHQGSKKGYYWKIEIELPDLKGVYDFLINAGYNPDELETKTKEK